MKSQALRAKAESMYVAGGYGYDEIAAQLDVAEKTLRLWSAEGRWAEKREKFRAQSQSIESKLAELTDNMLSGILQDTIDKKQVDPGRYYALANFLGKLEAARKYDAAKKSEASPGAAAGPGGITEDTLKAVEESLKIM